MIRYLRYEAKISVPWGLLLLPLLPAILRLTKAISPEVPETWVGWVSFLELVFPVLFPLLAFGLFDREKRWRTLEVTVAAPRRKGLVFLVRFLFLIFPLFLSVAAAVRPREYLLLVAPGIALGGAALLGGVALGEEAGLGLALGWWGVSFALRVAGAGLMGFQSWILLFLSGSPFSHSEIFLRKWVHLGLGVSLVLLALAVAEWKRSWSPR